MGKIYLIAAPPRSGTSMIAGLMYRCGAWVGDCIPADKHNQQGYYENKEMVSVTRRIFQQNNMPFRSDTLIPTIVKCSFNLRSMFEKITGNQDIWLYKDSKILLVYQAFIKAFPEAIWILPYREPEKIIESLQNHAVWKNRYKQQNSERLLSRMVSRLHYQQKQLKRLGNVKTFTVDSDEIITSKKLACNFIESIGLQFDEKAYNEFIKPGLWHG